MCGRYYIDIDMKEIKSIIEEAEKNIYRDYKVGEIFPSNIAPIYIKDENAMKPILAKWGFPKWDGKGLIINARAESIEDKHMFKKLLKSNRCTVPASAYFEWKQNSPENKTKDKYIIHKPNSIMYFAGLYNIVSKHKNEQLSLFETNEWDIYYTIMTKESHSSISHIHDRMPVIFDNSEMNNWLNGEPINNIINNNDNKLLSEIMR